MTRIAILALILGLAGPACAGVDKALDRHILPGLTGFVAATEDLAQTATAECRPEVVAPAYNAAFDAWMPVADLRLGPSETGALSIAFWPDTRGFTQRTLLQFVAEQDQIAFDPQGYDAVSIAARGLFALERLLFDPDFSDYDPDSYTCTLVQTIATDLARQAKALETAWRDDFDDILRTAGDAGNATYLDQGEALRALYTQLLGGLEFTADQRLGRPMGTFAQPRPTRAEAWRSERSLRNVRLSVDAAQALAHTLVEGDLPETAAAAAQVHEVANRVSDPGFQDVADPQSRLHVELLQQAVRNMHAAIEAEIGAPLGIAPGFNSQDGD